MSIIIKFVPEEAIFKCKMYDNAGDDGANEDEDEEDERPLTN
jgi:hypothetical protein